MGNRSFVTQTFLNLTFNERFLHNKKITVSLQNCRRNMQKQVFVQTDRVRISYNQLDQIKVFYM